MFQPKIAILRFKLKYCHAENIGVIEYTKTLLSPEIKALLFKETFLQKIDIQFPFLLKLGSFVI